MSGAGPIRPTLEQMRLLHSSTKGVHRPQMTALRLCLETLALPWEVVAFRLENIQWRRGCVEVPARGIRRTRIVALPTTALQTILQVAGSAGGKGQAVTAGRGDELNHRDLRLDRLRETLGRAAPNTLSIDWNFHGLRAAGAEALRRSGLSSTDLDALLGFEQRGGDRRMTIDRADRAISAAERWSRLLHG